MLPPPLINYFADLKDPRIDRTKRHKFIDIIVCTLCAVICGADGWKDIEAFCEAKLDWLQQFLELPNGVPSDDTFRRVVSRIQSEAFEQCFFEWTTAIGSYTGLINIDGKTLRGSGQGSTPALHLVSAWATELHLVLGQRKVDSKTNEITVIPELLDMLMLEDSIVSIDAMGTQKQIAKQIVDQGGDYVLALKGNHPILYDDVKTFFAEAKAIDFQGVSHDYHQHTDGGHGRIEVRQCWCSSDIDWIIQAKQWKGLNSITMVESKRIMPSTAVFGGNEGDQISVQQRYYLSSLEADASLLAASIRGHWGIENQLHWVLDVSFSEDQSRIRDGAENMGIFRRMALNLIRQESTSKLSLKARRKKAGWDNDYLRKILKI